MTESEIIGKLKESILIFDVELAEKSAQEAVNNDIDPLKAVEEGLVKGLDIIGEKYENDEIFLPELMMAANTFQTAMQILEPKISEKGQERAKKVLLFLERSKATFIKLEKILLHFCSEQPVMKFMTLEKMLIFLPSLKTRKK